MKAKALKTGLLAAAAGTLLAMADGATAATVVYKDSGFIYGTTPTYSSNSFTISDAGQYKATLVDYDFPQPLGALGLLINDGGTVKLGELNSPGSFTFNAQPGTYAANLFGLGGAGLQLGLYGVSVQMIGAIEPPAPVALPPAVILLASAMGLFGVVARRRREPAALAAAA